MKLLRSFLFVLALIVLGSAGLQAQSGGPSAHSAGSGASGPTVQCVCDLVNGDVSTGCYSTKNGLGNNPWSMSLVVDILKPAKDHFSLSLGQMIQRYHDCGCVITYLGDGWFRVQVGGDIIVVLTGLE